MRRILLFAALSGWVAGCASTGLDRPAVCDGRQRRPANLYGSILSPPTPPAETSDDPGSAPSPDATAPSAAVPSNDQYSALPAFASC